MISDVFVECVKEKLKMKQCGRDTKGVSLVQGVRTNSRKKWKVKNVRKKKCKGGSKAELEEIKKRKVER